MNTLVSLNEIALMPNFISFVRHRKDVNPFYGDKLPIFVSPMTCILNRYNFDTFYNSKVIPIYPVIKRETNERLNTFFKENEWRAVTLDEFKHMFNSCTMQEDVPDEYYHILIDCANGHMSELFDIVKDAKQEYGNKLVVMTGNIANPDTYIECCKAQIDYVRVGIGGNIACETGSKTGIHISLAYLLSEINKIRKDYTFDGILKTTNGIKTKVVADGGIDTIDKAMKCLALGADYVMLGRMIAKCKESCNLVHVLDGIKEDGSQKRLYYGQASLQGQIDRFGKASNYEEGSSVYIPIEYTLDEFCTEFENVLRSLMSYTNHTDLKDLIGNVIWKTQSIAEYQTFNK